MSASFRQLAPFGYPGRGKYGPEKNHLPGSCYVCTLISGIRIRNKSSEYLNFMA